jgi:hypothetical protein
MTSELSGQMIFVPLVSGLMSHSSMQFLMMMHNAAGCIRLVAGSGGVAQLQQ